MSTVVQHHARPGRLNRRPHPLPALFAALKRGRMHYFDVGKGEPVLLVHGTPASSIELRHLIRSLSRTFRVIVPDHLGFGLSQHPRDGAYTPEAHAANLEEFVRRLGLCRPALVVHDVGGPIALPLALAGSISRLVLLNTRMPSLAAQRRPASKEGTWLLARPINGRSADRDDTLRRADQLRSLPALIIWGMQDGLPGPELLTRWRELLPDAPVLELADPGHGQHMEGQAAVSELVGAFLEATSPVWRRRAAARRTALACA